VQDEVVEDHSKEPQKDSVVNKIDRAYKTVDQIKLENGIEIKWFVHGNGDKLELGDVVSIDYKVYLMDSSIVDGNHLLQKESMPFMIGFNMQTEGWDIALKELKVGDFAEIYIPSNLARGEKGIEGLIPANADNILKIRILDVVAPTKETDGNKVWLLEENTTNTEAFNKDNEIEFHCMVSTPTNPLYVNTFRSNNTFKLRYGDRGTVPGLKKSLINAKKSDRFFVLVPASEGYGAKGYQDIVKPNEYLFYNILVMNVIE
jgi:FKBP-type peptidyl-prolyl cis-trans isomerase